MEMEVIQQKDGDDEEKDVVDLVSQSNQLITDTAANLPCGTGIFVSNYNYRKIL